MSRLLETIQKKVVIPQYEYKLAPQDAQLGEFVLPETAKDAICKNARFKKDVNDRILIYKFDQTVKDIGGNTISEPLLFLQPGEARSKCDYIMFYPYHNPKKGVDTLYVFLCNLKSGNRSNNATQLQAGEDFAKLIVATGSRIAKERDFHKVVFLKMLFWNNPLTIKGTSKPKKNSTSYRIGAGGYIEFNCGKQTCDLRTLCQIHSAK